MQNTQTKTLFERYIEKQPEKLAIREVYFGHIGSYNHGAETILTSNCYNEELAKADQVKANLIPLLNDEQIKELDKLLELTEIENIESKVSCYESGFKLGVNLGIESGKFIKQ